MCRRKFQNSVIGALKNNFPILSKLFKNIQINRKKLKNNCPAGLVQPALNPSKDLMFLLLGK